MPGQKRVRELSDMPRVETHVAPDVLDAFKENAQNRGVSTATVLREALYEYARDYLCVEAEAPRPTKYVRA